MARDDETDAHGDPRRVSPARPNRNDFTIRCSDLSENPLLIRRLSRHIRMHSGETIERSKTNESPKITLSPHTTHLCELAKIATLPQPQAAVFAAPPPGTQLALAPACVGHGPTSAQPTPVHTRRARRPANGDFSPNGEKWRLGDRGKRSPAARHRPPRCLRLLRGA